MRVDELRERIAEVFRDEGECGAFADKPPLPWTYIAADRILAAVAGLFTDEQVEWLSNDVCEHPDYYYDEQGDALADTLAALRALAQPKEGSNG